MWKEPIKSAITEAGVSEIQSFLIRKGRGFTISDRYSSIAKGDSIFLFIENPTNSNYTYEFIVAYRASGLADIDVSLNATETTEGASVSVDNLNPDSSLSFNGSCTKTTTGNTGDYSHGTIISEDIVPAGDKQAGMGASIVDGISFRLPADNNMLIELTNESGGEVDRLSIHTILFMIDGKYVDK